MKRFLSLLVMLTILFPALYAKAAEGDFPTLNDAGYLEEGEFVYQSADTGVWLHP